MGFPSKPATPAATGWATGRNRSHELESANQEDTLGPCVSTGILCLMCSSSVSAALKCWMAECNDQLGRGGVGGAEHCDQQSDCPRPEEKIPKQQLIKSPTALLFFLTLLIID